GPTEGTILASSHEAAAAGMAVRLPIGRPLSGTRLRVLGHGGLPVPISVPGELHIGGRGVARGYLGRPELTAERFVPLSVGDRWYRTGDLTRFRPDGSLEFLGRIDHQVKVRGFRIELGEIESVLQEQPEVRAAAVVAREQPGTGALWLVAYLVFAPEAQAPALAELRGRLAARLPDYMVPARFVALPALPLTSTGKVDRRALPAPEPGRREERGEAARGMSPAEQRLADLWAKLLGVERVEAHDDFFELGGHSLLATRLLSRVREAFGVEVPIRALFDAPTVAGLAAYLAVSGATSPPPPLRPVPRPETPETGLPLSFAQERLWFLDRLEPGGSVYNIPAAVRLAGPLGMAACGAALDEVMRRHEALRTGFREGPDGQPVQVIEPWSPLGLPAVDLSALSGEAREAEVRRLVREEAGRPFDLAAGRPLRAAVLRLDAAAAEHVLLLTVHHIAADGWSVGILVRELAALYGAFRAGRPAAAAGLPELPVQYADFAAWQREWLSGAALETQMAHWRRALAGAATLELPTDRPRPAVRNPRGARREVALPPALAEDLRRLARGQGATPFMVLLAAFEIFLGRLSGQEDVLVGTPIANRTHHEIEGLIGFFVNTLVLRGDLSGDPDFVTLVRRTREVTLAAYAHQDLPFEKLVEELAPARDASRTPLFQVMFTLQDSAPEAGMAGLGDLAAEALEVASETAKFDLGLALARATDGGFGGALEYSADLFDALTVARLAGRFEILLAAAAATPGWRIWELPLLAPVERAVLLLEWNDTGLESRRRPVASVPLAVEEQARRRPDAVAVAAPEGLLSYGELNRRANRLAWRLRALGVGPEVPVAICAERSTALIVGLLAILEAGGAYVPLDPTHPPARLALVLADLAAGIARPVVLVQEHLRGRLPEEPAGSPRAVLSLDDFSGPDEQEDDPPLPPLPPIDTAGQRAYVIYTSGSTGTPKGVE
ncbi:MAG TPA: condensation domain-containing protein, partial [Thermoanaerobaculia bacterium]|nr:condensation domain-containing protein [Thermoanaerobaculia bacterium]